MKLSTNFRQPQLYKQSILESFRDLPASSLSLLTTLLALDPTHRGTAASALQNEVTAYHDRLAHQVAFLSNVNKVDPVNLAFSTTLQLLINLLGPSVLFPLFETYLVYKKN